MGLRQYEMKKYAAKGATGDTAATAAAEGEEGVIEKYEKCGYTLPPLSKALDVFLHAYADEDGVPGCYEECASICQVEGIRELLDLRMLAKRTFLGDYFPAKVALRFENAFESPKVEKVTSPPKCSTMCVLHNLRTETACAAVHAGNQPSRESNGKWVHARPQAVDKHLPPEDDTGSGGGAVCRRTSERAACAI